MKSTNTVVSNSPFVVTQENANQYLVTVLKNQEILGKMEETIYKIDIPSYVEGTQDADPVDPTPLSSLGSPSNISNPRPNTPETSYRYILLHKMKISENSTKHRPLLNKILIRNDFKSIFTNLKKH